MIKTSWAHDLRIALLVAHPPSSPDPEACAGQRHAAISGGTPWVMAVGTPVCVANRRNLAVLCRSDPSELVAPAIGPGKCVIGVADLCRAKMVTVRPKGCDPGMREITGARTHLGDGEVSVTF